MHQSFETPAPPPIRAIAGSCGDFHLMYTSFWFPGRRGIRLKSRSSHPLPIICWPLKDQSVYFMAANSVSVNQCVTLGRNKLWYKGSTMCWKVAAGECTTHFCPREPGISLTFTCIKTECPAQARMGGCGGFKWLVHYSHPASLALLFGWSLCIIHFEGFFAGYSGFSVLSKKSNWLFSALIWLFVLSCETISWNFQVFSWRLRSVHFVRSYSWISQGITHWRCWKWVV